MPTIASPENVTGMLSLFQWLNNATTGAFGWMFMIIFFSVTFLVMKIYDTERAFAAATFLTGLLGLSFGALGIVTQPVILGSVLLMLIGGAGVVWRTT